MARPSPDFQLDFLAYLQRLLDEGEFVATYKFALLMALADLSVELGEDSDSPLPLTSLQIAEKFVQYYWRQARPYVPMGRGATARELWQNTGRQARVVTLVKDVIVEYGGQSELSRISDPDFNRLVRTVARTVQVMPLWKLQTIAGEDTAFLYENSEKAGQIELKPGIAYCFRRFHGFVQQLAQSGWIQFIRRCRQNRDLLGEHTDLGEFLFGLQRASLEGYRPLLMDLQKATCFYCGTRLRRSEVDHFIPWARYNTDLGHNFVLACTSCNGDKRDKLAARQHLDRWIDRNLEHGRELERFFEEQQASHDLQGSFTIAHWAYSQAVQAHGRAWVHRNRTIPIAASWLDAFET